MADNKYLVQVVNPSSGRILPGFIVSFHIRNSFFATSSYAHALNSKARPNISILKSQFLLKFLGFSNRFYDQCASHIVRLYIRFSKMSLVTKAVRDVFRTLSLHTKKLFLSNCLAKNEVPCGRSNCTYSRIRQSR